MMKTPFCRPVKVYDENRNFVNRFTSIREASLKLGVDYRRVSGVCGWQKTARGNDGKRFYFEYDKDGRNIDIKEIVDSLWNPCSVYPPWEISNKGQIRNRDRRNILRSFLGNDGYLHVHNNWSIHRLACEAWHGPPTIQGCAGDSHRWKHIEQQRGKFGMVNCGGRWLRRFEGTRETDLPT